MSAESELPDEVLAELKSGRKISAIKKLRVARGIGLKEAKTLVDAYLDQQPAGSTRRPPRAETGIGRIVILILGVGIIYAIYQYLR